MAYKFSADERVPDAMLRCAREQLDRAVNELSEGISQDPVAAVHNARKAIKKERSLLRLTRGAIPRGLRRRENSALRDVANSLSGTRDADVMLASVDQLSERFAGQLPANTFGAIRKRLESRRGATPSGGPGPARDMEAIRELGEVRIRIDEWHVRTGGWKAIESGLLRTYKQGRRAFRHARASGETEDLHDWRKRVRTSGITSACSPRFAGEPFAATPRSSTSWPGCSATTMISRC